MNLESQFGVTDAQIEHAAALLRAGKLVAFPTETVYGLGANALDAVAVARIFEAKGRPNTSPLIVHVSSVELVSTVAAEWPERAQILAERFWPGPLTLVLRKQPAVPDIVTAGLPAVGIRVPAHPLALELLRRAHIPVAAPSANRFTQLSPTTADHVRRSLGDRVDFILDGGPCTVGIESTVVSLAGESPVLLRPGGVSRSEIEALIGPVRIQNAPTQAAHASPGQHPRHYSPRTALLLVRDGAVPEQGRGAYLQLQHPPSRPVRTVQMPQDAKAYAAQLYATLHDLDVESLDWIAVETPEPYADWESVLDRLKRAAAK